MPPSWTQAEYEQWKNKAAIPLEIAKKFMPEPKPAKRVRQGEVKLRPWEQEWKEYLEASGNWCRIKAQSFRFRVANGAWYKPDVSAVPFVGDKIHCFEVKGGKKMKGVAKGVLVLKVAASLYPEISWVLCWKENGDWKQQTILS